MTSDVDINNSILPTAISVPNSSKIAEQGHAVIILASGLSRRLGQSKQLLSKNSEPLICYMTKLALTTKPHAIIVVIPQDQSMIAHAINKLNLSNAIIQPVMNPIPETGMAHSLHLGITALINLERSLIQRVLIMGIDQVLLDNNHLTALLTAKSPVVASSYHYLDEAFSSDENKANIIGLPIVINVERLKQWQPALIGDKGLRHLIRALPSNQLSTVINHQLSYDIDMPEQLFYARQQQWLDA